MANFGCWLVSRTGKIIKLRDGTDADSPSLFIGSAPVWARKHLAESFRGDSDLVAINDKAPTAAALKKQDKNQADQRAAALARKVDARARMYGTSPPGVAPPAGRATPKTVDTSAPGLARDTAPATPAGLEPDPLDEPQLEDPEDAEHVDPEDAEASPLEGMD